MAEADWDWDAWPPAFERKRVGKLKVIQDRVLPSGLSSFKGDLVGIRGIRVLTLEDESERLGCNDCEFVTDDDALSPLGDIRKHRNAEHGVSMGGTHRRTTTRATAGEAEARGETANRRLPMPSANALAYSMWEILEFMTRVDDWEDAFAAQAEIIAGFQARLDAETQRANVAERALKSQTAKLKRLVGE